MIRLTVSALRQIYPHAPQGVIEAFLSDKGHAALAAVGINANRQRLAVALAQCDHETNGFTITNLTENINYTAERMAEVWPNRFRDADMVRSKYGTGAGWQRRAFDDIYGGRMGNRPGTSDGSAFIGRGGPQVTGADGYEEVGKRCGLPLKAQPELACRPEYQPQILAGFWSWKILNTLADTKGIDGTTPPWNGGTNGLADRRARFARIKPIIDLLSEVSDVPPVGPPMPIPPPPDIPKPQPVPQPASGGFFLALITALVALFKRK